MVEGLPDVPEIGVENEEHETTEATVLTASASQPQLFISASERIIKTSGVKVLQQNKKYEKPKCTINSTINKFTNVKETEALELKAINEKLEKLIEQNETIIWLKKKKMELKYNVSFEELDANGRCNCSGANKFVISLVYFITVSEVFVINQ